MFLKSTLFEWSMQRRQHFAAVTYSEEERTEIRGMIPTQQMQVRERWV
jgi:hypothetical protein